MRALVLALLSSAPALAAPPARLNYQGVLRSGGVAANGQHALEFRLYDASSGGSLLWNSGAVTAQVENGIFSAELSGGAPVLSTETLRGGAAFLEVSVNGTPLTPRERIVSAAFALQAGSVDGGQVRVENSPSSPPSPLGPGSLYYNSGTEQVYFSNNGSGWVALAAGGPSPWTRSGSSVFPSVASDNVGIGSGSPDQRLTVSGNASLTGVLIASGPGSNYLAGAVGVGTASPLAKLEVAGGSLRALSQAVPTLPGSGTGVELYYDGGADQGRLLSTNRAGTHKPLLLDGSSVGLNSISGGNVGVGTASPGAKLEVSGSVKIVDGTQGSGKVLTSDAAGAANWQDPPTLPAGAVMFFALTSCPSGWSELTAARGRYLVGLPAGASSGTAVGTALSDAENRAVGQHSHAVTDPGHTHPLTQSSQNVSTALASLGVLIPSGSAASGSSTTGITVDNAGSVAGTNAPYVQLLVCVKS